VVRLTEGATDPSASVTLLVRRPKARSLATKPFEIGPEQNERSGGEAQTFKLVRAPVDKLEQHQLIPVQKGLTFTTSNDLKPVFTLRAALPKPQPRT
jgi:hypothetical protein